MIMMDETWRSMTPWHRWYAGLLGMIDANIFLERQRWGGFTGSHRECTRQLANAMITHGRFLRADLPTHTRSQCVSPDLPTIFVPVAPLITRCEHVAYEMKTYDVGPDSALRKVGTVARKVNVKKTCWVGANRSDDKRHSHQCYGYCKVCNKPVCSPKVDRDCWQYHLTHGMPGPLKKAQKRKAIE
jgi:hypothetical protein